jgi:predicted nucleic acid-binding protein
MALHDLADPTTPLPAQLVFDTSFLLALRPGDDNPHAEAAQGFARRLRPAIAALELVAWLVLPVLQECYHIILTGSLRRAWQTLDPAMRPANWLALYKQEPDTLAQGLPELNRFDALLATIPATLARPQDQALVSTAGLPDERLRYFIARYRFLPQDALILAEAERLGVTTIATLDSDWRRVTEFDIYTTPCSD